jgi:CHAT domain-containing protein
MFSKDPVLLDRFIKNLQLIKGQQLWSNLIENEASVFGKVPYDILIQERDLLVDIQKYEKELRRAKRKKDSARVREIESELLFNSQEAYSNLKLKMEKDYPEYYEAKFDFKPESISSLQSILGDDEVLVEWVVERDEVYVFILEKNKPAEVLKTAFLKKQIDSIYTFCDILMGANVMRKKKRNEFVEHANSVYKVIFEPLVPFLKGKKRLILIPDNFLFYVPFEALISSAEDKSLKDLNYLIKDYEVSYHYSTKLFARARRSKLDEQFGIYAFAPVYDEKKSPNAPEGLNNIRSVDIDGKFSPLPESEKEVNRILELFQRKKYRNAVALRGNASEGNLKNELQSNHQFVHIAGHSFANEKNSNFSGIACYSTGDPKEDNILYAGEISYLDIQADLITLSSCESGFGRLESTEGLLGLNRSFIYAGAPNVLFSLWKVYDKVSAEMMVEFYKNVLEGQTYSSSLRNAKLKLLEKNTTANPHFWAPFLLIGR